MSTGADCFFEEKELGQWWYSIQKYPYGATPDYDENGPFTSFVAAERHLDNNYANPGGFSAHLHKDNPHNDICCECSGTFLRKGTESLCEKCEKKR